MRINYLTIPMSMLFAFNANQAISQDIFDRMESIDSYMSCTINGPDGVINLQVRMNQDQSLHLRQDGEDVGVIVEGDGAGQYIASEDGELYAILMDPSIEAYYIFSFDRKTARIFALGGLVDVSGNCD